MVPHEHASTPYWLNFLEAYRQLPDSSQAALREAMNERQLERFLQMTSPQPEEVDAPVEITLEMTAPGIS